MTYGNEILLGEVGVLIVVFDIFPSFVSSDKIGDFSPVAKAMPEYKDYNFSSPSKRRSS
jgi:hypothetical protein